MKKFTLYDSNGDKYDSIGNKQDELKGGNPNINIYSPLIPSALMGHAERGVYPRAERLSPSLSEFAPGSGLMPSTPAFTSTSITPAFPMSVGVPAPTFSFGSMSPLIRNPYLHPTVRVPPLAPSPFGVPTPMGVPPFVPVTGPHSSVVSGPIPGIPGVGLVVSPSSSTVTGSGYLIVAPSPSDRRKDEYILAREYNDSTILMSPVPLTIPTSRKYTNRVNIFGRHYHQSRISDPIGNANNALSHMTENNVSRSTASGNRVSTDFEITYRGRKFKVFVLLLNTPFTINHESIIRFDADTLEACVSSGATTCRDTTGVTRDLSSGIINTVNHMLSLVVSSPLPSVTL
jgi:hypothetical protein